MHSFYAVSIFSSFMRSTYESDLKYYIYNHEDINFSNSIDIDKIYISHILILEIIDNPKLTINIKLPLKIKIDFGNGMHMNPYLYVINLYISTESIYISTIENLLNTKDFFINNFHINRYKYIHDYLTPVMCNIQHRFCEDIRIYLPELKELIVNDHISSIKYLGGG